MRNIITITGASPIVSGSPQAFGVTLLHKFCGGRKICSDGVTPTAVLSFDQASIKEVGAGVYAVTLNVTGSITYAPKSGNCGCACDCPKTDAIMSQITVFTGINNPVIAASGVVAVSVIRNPGECCTADGVRVDTSITLTAPAA